MSNNNINNKCPKKKPKSIGLESTMFRFQTPSVTHHSLGPTASWPGCSFLRHCSASEVSFCRKRPLGCVCVAGCAVHPKCSSVLVTSEQKPQGVPISLALFLRLPLFNGDRLPGVKHTASLLQGGEQSELVTFQCLVQEWHVTRSPGSERLG